MEPEKDNPTPTEDYQRIEQAIHYLEDNFRNQPTLEEIAASVHLSPYHFQRLFKRWAGISPTQFLHFLTLEYAKERLKQSHSILQSTVEAGLSSPSRLHDLFITFEAITPGEYKRQGAGLEINYGWHPSPFGDMLLAQTSRGICALYFRTGQSPEEMVQELQHDWPNSTIHHNPQKTAPAANQIFTPVNPTAVRKLHLYLKGTNFQIQVWQALLKIPAGSMVTYGDIAQFLGNPKGARAVGSAVGSNLVSYLIPCHRVITHSGDTHQYRWGTSRKKALLGWEAARQV